MLELVRYIFSPTNTIGELYLNGEMLSHTLEDVVRNGDDGKLEEVEKVFGQTAIPYGRYEVVVNRSERFKRDLPLLLNVPLFTGVRLHPGNNESHTNGCILCGDVSADFSHLVNSRKVFDEAVFPAIKAALQKGKLYIDVRRK